MRRNLFIVLCTVFSANLAIGTNKVVLNCPCHLKISCFKPLNISNGNETSCADENFVRCCSEAEPIVKQTVVVSSTMSTEPKHVDNISVVLPSEMSGIPQTTPSSIAGDYMIEMMDIESGNQMLLVFPKYEETSSDAPTTTTTLTKPSSSSTTTVKTTEAPSSRPITTPAVTVNNTVSNIKRKRIPEKRRRTNQNNQQESQVKERQETPKPNAKIYDVSMRTHFLRRHHDTPLEIIEPPVLSTRPTPRATKTPGFQRISNNELRFKIDQEHKTMIETLRDLLNANDNSPIHRPFDTGKGQRFKSFDRLVNVEMEKLIENMNVDRKPYRGKIKFQDYKWAEIPDNHKEERLPPTQNTSYRGKPPTQNTPNRGNYKWAEIPDNHQEERLPPPQNTPYRGKPPTPNTPNRGNYKRAEISDNHQEERLPPTQNTPNRGNTKWAEIPDNHQEERLLPTQNIPYRGTPPTPNTPNRGNYKRAEISDNHQEERLPPTQNTPNRGNYKWAEITDNHQEERLPPTQNTPYRGKPPTQNTPYRGNYKWDAIPDGHVEQWSPPATSTKRKPSLPYNEFMKLPILLSDFVPSPLWSLQADNIEIFNTRNPTRRYVTLPFEYVGAENKFVPEVRNGESLQIVGPIPEGFKSRIDDSRLSYDLPTQAVSNF